jgi:acetylornithine/succinyldiaminopimelate/putrescine aminotransferase
MNTRHPFLDTCDELIARRTPNLFRLYLNPHVVQTCLCLARYVQDTWHAPNPEKPTCQSFLANSFDEALSGAIKLARYAANIEDRSQRGLVLDFSARLGPFASVAAGDNSRIEFVPNLAVVGRKDIESGVAFGPEDRFGFAVLVLSPVLAACENLDEILSFLERQSALRIVCVDRPGLERCRRSASALRDKLTPDIVVFDESFVQHQVPFGAFTARKTLYDYWNTSRNATFHSTTYQPNSISTLHFLKCVEKDDPEFFSRLSGELESIRADPAICQSLFGELYNPSLRKTIAVLGLDTLDMHAAGHYVIARGRRIFDGVGGVACSVRGHNPENYVAELADLHPVTDYHRAVAERLRELTGLEYLLPAVSGASAVENALRIGLVSQHPNKYVLALKGGFGGKTLLALTGTARESYKKHLGSLYEKVLYIDPFADSALQDLDAALDNHPVGIVQMELIQAVGGIRAVPEKVVRHLEARRRDRGYLLFVDEVQTGMYRTGPFSLSQKMGIAPDLLTIGKGTSDMMCPFAVTLYSAAVQARLEAAGSDLPRSLRRRCDYEFGYKTLLNTLTRAEKIGLSERVSQSGALFAELLADRLSPCKAVRDVRVFGLLIAIELNTNSWLQQRFKGKAPSFYIYDLLRHPSFPVFMGYCQYEPNVLKFTPPLSITRAEIELASDTIAATLHTPFYRLLPPVLRVLAATYVRDKWKGY